ncbi:MAG TPA: hypothetical protein VHD36_13285 [Pirellulales bacterium]|nr:hypothetical protein [Pirellulales bacterium]
MRPEPYTQPRTWTARRLDVNRRPEVREHLRDALSLLLRAYDYASELNQDVWSFAVEMPVLSSAHLTTSDLRWLACKGYVDHASEITKAEDHERHFRHNGAARFSSDTCVVLTQSGAALAREVCGESRVLTATEPRVAICRVPASEDLSGLPKWDRDRRQLRFDGQVVKEFKLPSPNQEAVLMALEEEGWPARIDDPLSPSPNLDPRRRLHDTIKALNRNQKRTLLRFMGDGSGEGIRWEPATFSDDDAASD